MVIGVEQYMIFSDDMSCSLQDERVTMSMNAFDDEWILLSYCDNMNSIQFYTIYASRWTCFHDSWTSSQSLIIFFACFSLRGVTWMGKSWGSLEGSSQLNFDKRDHDHLLNSAKWTLIGANIHGLSVGIGERLEVERPEHAHSTDEDDLRTEVAGGADTATKAESVVALSEYLVASHVILG
jgi:hypothetical protein